MKSYGIYRENEKLSTFEIAETQEPIDVVDAVNVLNAYRSAFHSLGYVLIEEDKWAQGDLLDTKRTNA